MIEIGVLAAYVVSSFLVPLVKEGAGQLTSKLTEKTSESTANGLVGTARKLWDRVRGKSEGVDADIVSQFERNPDKMSSHLEAVVKGLLEEDPEFHKEVSRLVESEEDGSPRWQLMGKYAGGVDARKARISGNAIVAGVNVGSPERHEESKRLKDD
jgi:hypothetical protein